MKFCSRSTFGVVIGGLNIFGSIALIIFLIVLLVQNGTTEPKTEEEQFAKDFLATACILRIIIYLLMAITSGLLIMGILKRSHKLMKPWVVLSGSGIVFSCVRFAILFVSTLNDGAPTSTVLTILFVGVILLGISALIVWAIYKLYRDIREENIKKPMGDNGIPYQLQNNY